MEVGVLGGAFDPVHLGHLVIAEEVTEQLGLEQVVFVPTGKPWLKERELSPPQHRLEMLRRAVADNPAFRLSTLEVGRPGISYTVDTLEELGGQLGAGAHLYFILGWDALAYFPYWREPQRILELASVVAVPRPGAEPPDVARLETELPGLARRLRLVGVPRLEISSTDIRARVRAGRSVRYLVPGAVADYIREQGLYR